MRQFGRWLYKRLVCLVHGHRMERTTIFSPSAKAVIPGFRCTRCEKTQAMLLRWQVLEPERGES